MHCADPAREAAYYETLMNWRVRSDDGSTIVLDIGDGVGSVVIRGGFVAPPPPADAASGRGGRGRGRAPRHVAWDSFCWAIEPWDARTVAAELRARGLDPIADHDGNGFESFHVRDPDFFDLQISNLARTTRRGAGRNAPATPAPFDRTAWRTVWLDHISFQSANYKESVAFYAALLGWTPTGDEGSQNECEIGDAGNIIIRGGNPNGRGGGAGRGAADSSRGRDIPPTGGRGGGGTPVRRATIDHIAFGITPWDPDAVKAELDQRGLTSRADTGGKGDIHDAPYQSYHTTTPDGFDLQISNATRERRAVR